MSDEKQKFLEKVYQISGSSFEDIVVKVNENKLTKHSEIRSFLIEILNLGYGDANTLTHYVLNTDSESMAEGKSMTDILNEIYCEKKAPLREIHDAVMQRLNNLGAFEVIPKKGYVSLKRNKQFAMIGPKTNTRVEIGINSKTLTENQRLIGQPKGSMCQFIVKLTHIDEVDDELIAWLKEAYDQS